MKKIIPILLLLLGLTLILELAGRLLQFKELRSFQQLMKRTLYQIDPYLEYSMKPNFTILYGGETPVTTNSRGWRDREYEWNKAEGVFRIVCIGDSRMFGLGLEAADTLSEQLEKILKERFPGHQIEVINAGVPGYTSDQGMVLVDEKLPPLQPDLIIASFGHNDRWRSPKRGSRIATFFESCPRNYQWGIGALIAKAAPLLRWVPWYSRPPAGNRGGPGDTSRALPTIEEEFRTNVSLPAYEQNVRRMARSAHSRGTAFILVHLAENPAIFDRTERGAKLLEAGKIEEAKEILEKAVDISLNFSPAPYYYLGLLHRMQGEYKQAEEFFLLAELGARLYPYPLEKVKKISQKRGLTERKYSEKELAGMEAIQNPYGLIEDYARISLYAAGEEGAGCLIVGREDTREWMFIDADHPSKEGNARLAEMLSRKIEPYFRSRSSPPAE